MQKRNDGATLRRFAAIRDKTGRCMVNMSSLPSPPPGRMLTLIATFLQSRLSGTWRGAAWIYHLVLLASNPTPIGMAIKRKKRKEGTYKLAMGEIRTCHSVVCAFQFALRLAGKEEKGISYSHEVRLSALS